MKDITTKAPKDLIKMINEKRADLQAFRFGGAGSKVKNVKEGRNIRKDIARLMTALTVATKETSATKKKAKKSEKSEQTA